MANDYNPDTGQGGKGQYNAVVTGGDAAGNYGNYDPLGLGGLLSGALGGLIGGQNNVSAPTNPGYDPNAFFKQFEGNAGAIGNMVNGQLSPLEAMMTARAGRLSEAAGRSMAGAFGSQGYGALRSGAAAGAIGGAMAEPFAAVQEALGQKQIDLTGQMWNNAMGIGGQQQAQAGQLGLGYGGLGLQAAQGNQNALLTALGLGADSMTTVAPQYEYKPTGFESLMGYLQPILGAAAGGLTGGLTGGAGGAISGAMGGKGGGSVDYTKGT